MRGLSLLAALFSIVCSLSLVLSAAEPEAEHDMVMLDYNQPDLVVDLGVGLWSFPMPIDYDHDGDLDLVVSCPDKPYNGTYFFENPDGNVKFPVFKPGVKIGFGSHNMWAGQAGDQISAMLPGREFSNFTEKQFSDERKLPVDGRLNLKKEIKTRANQWSYADYNGDGVLDLVVGMGEWQDYGWDDAYNDEGEWTNGPLHGFVYVLINKGSYENPDYAEPEKIQAGGAPVDVYGRPTPNFADFDNDGDLDLMCGEFVDKFTYFENIGSRTEPEYASGQYLMHDGEPLTMELEMITPYAVDWDGDNDVDLVVGDEDGRVALVEHTGKVENGQPVFLPPVYFQQQANHIKFGALATPYGYDWDGDGDEDVLCGNTAGHIALFENLGGGETPKFAGPELLEADGKTIRIMAGPNGSIQGPCESKWGYTTLTVADWNGDDLPDIMANSIWGKIVWYENIGTRTEPKLAAEKPVEVEWDGPAPKPAWFWWTPEGKALVTQWRTTPSMVDFNEDGLMDLVMLDHEGYFAFFERTQQDGQMKLQPGKRIFVDENGELFQPNPKRAGGSGRRKIQIVDWNGDGKLDVLMNSINADLYLNEGTKDGKVVLSHQGPLAERKVSGHSSSPTVVDWNKDGIPDLLVGAEDGHLYYKRNPRSDK
ncbi:FG-GAP repeat protein [Polystyrenella longa]|uniref:FG-GAP repeat protein n=1 Tax=Polystyrenella longa TaxID=2528007 RepID=A0A518CUI8_9PLAN|nr:VCBS repeat-containing protein [Polystyrenella longa]QDU82891.1 FG-GAP repeat protein [Polystyrenella longa]